jgi:hypothetical protein
LLEFMLSHKWEGENAADRDLAILLRWQNRLAVAGFVALGLAAVFQTFQGDPMPPRDKSAEMSVHNLGGLRRLLSACPDPQSAAQPSTSPSPAETTPDPATKATGAATPESSPAPAASSD